MNETTLQLIEQLNHANVGVRSQAVLSLGKSGDASAVEPLIGVLCADSNLHVQEDATWSLARIGSPAVEPLIRCLTDPNPKVRHNAAHTLGKIGDARALDSLIATLQDADPAVRYKAAFALGQIHDAKAVPALVGTLADASLNVQGMAVEVLSAFGAAAVPSLAQALRHENEQVRELAAGILGDIGDAQAVAPLIETLADESWQVRFAAADALRQIKDAQAAEPLRRLLDDSDSRVRSMAAAALKQLGAA